jgi:leader peptidase (prepilin peptidase)/N-methyltransferase
VWLARTALLALGNVGWAAAVVAVANRRLRDQRRSVGRSHRFAEEAIVLLAAPAIAVAASGVFDSGWIAALVASFLVFCAISALVDIRWRIIPNALVYPAYGLYAVAVCALAATGQGVEARVALFGMVAYGGGLLILALLWPGGMGIGDVKLAGLIGLVMGALGWTYVEVAMIAAFLVGGLAGGALLATGSGRRTKIPFGPYLALGAIVAAFWAHTVSNLYLRPPG